MDKNLVAILDNFFAQVRQGRLKTFVPLLSLFYLRGKPMHLDTHYQFAPMYNVIMPRKQLWMTGRQMGKSFGISSSSALKSSVIPFFHTMLVQPRADQIQRLNNTVMKPLLQSSPVQRQLITKTELNKMALKQFKSGSLMYMDFCFQSPDRLRGASGLANIILDEIQDIEFGFLPVIQEVTSASQYWGYTQYAGTPKTTDTTLGLLWQRTSKAQWIIPCQHCGVQNIPNPEQHLLKMIGKTGIICHKCGRDLSTADGAYHHQIPARKTTFAGYHISQITHPFHLDKEHPQRWVRLLDKVQNYKTRQLYNEVFGWPYDQSTSPLILRQLLDARHQITVQNPGDLVQIRRNYKTIALGVDWGGGAQQSDSYTSMSLVGLRADNGTIDVLYGKRFDKATKPYDQASEVMSWLSATGADIFAHDASGPGGFLRMQIMLQLGLQQLNCTTIPYVYVGNMLGDTIKFHPATRESQRYYYSLDKARSLSVMVQAIKDKRIRVPWFQPQNVKHINYDYLALRQDPRTLAGNRTVVYIIKKPGVPDDHAHATNFAVTAIWDRHKIYPKLGVQYGGVQQLQMPMTQEYTYGQNQVFGPRSQFQQFLDAAHTRAQVIDPDYEPWL